MKHDDIFTKLVHDDKFEKIVEENCQIALTQNVRIYRGMKLSDSFFISAPPRNRPSANTFNYVTTFLDNIHPSWKKFPKRSESWVCTTNLKQAKGYGTGFVVLPFGDPDIGLIRRPDFWDVPKNDVSIHELNQFIYRIHLLLEMEDLVDSVPDYYDNAAHILDNELIRKIEYFQETRTESYDEEFRNHFLNLPKKYRNIKFSNFLLQILDPKPRKIDLIKLSELDQNTNNFKINELWFSAKCAFIHKNLFDIHDFLT